MQLKHRTPTIFSIYMVDVLCCALGCVVLMWQYNLNEANEKAAAELAALRNLDSETVKNKELNDFLADYQQRLATSDKKLAASEREKEQNRRHFDMILAALRSEKKAVEDKFEDKEAQYLKIKVQLKKTQEKRDQFEQLSLVYKSDYENAKKAEALTNSAKVALEKLLASERINFKNLTDEASDLKKKDVDNLARLANSARIRRELEKKIKEAETQLTALQLELEKTKVDVKTAGAKITATNVTLQDVLNRNRKLDKDVSDLEKKTAQLQADLKESKGRADLLDQENSRIRGELTDAKKRQQTVTTELADSKKRQQELTDDYSKLRKLIEASDEELAKATVEARKLRLENQRIRSTVEQRFAGITLTGNRVVFLVDMSGSMELVDEKTVDPDKWPIVCETVGKVMRSLPDLKQFQVIMFSDAHEDKKTGKKLPAAWHLFGHEGRWFEYEGDKTVTMTVDALKAVKPGGGTNMHAAFTEVFRYRPTGLDTVYFFSDGLPTSGEGLPANAAKLQEREITDILSKHLRKNLKSKWNTGSPRVRINTIGFFFESPEVGAFLWALAREHDGSFVGMSKP